MTEDIIVLWPFFSFADGSQSHHHDIHCHGCPGRHLLPSLQTVQGETAESEGVNTVTHLENQHRQAPVAGVESRKVLVDELQGVAL